LKNISQKPLKSYADILFGAGFFVFILGLFYPGIMNEDSTWQMMQAIKHKYSDMQPPAMAILWHYLQKIFGSGPFAMLLFQNLLFWSGAVFLVRAFPIPMRARLGAIAVFGLLLGGLTILGTVISNTLHGTVYFFAIAWFLYFINRRSLWALLALLPLYYGTQVRHEALGALIPLSFWMAWRIGDMRRCSLGTRLTAGFMIIAVSYGSLQLSFNLLTHTMQRRSDQYQLFMWHDLLALSLEANRILVPDIFLQKNNTTLEDFRRAYNPKGIFYYLKNKNVFKMTTEKENVKILKKAWKDSVFQNPMGYAEHRARYFYCYLLSSQGPSYLDKTRSEEIIIPEKINLETTGLFKWFNENILTQITKSPLFRAWPYFFLAFSVFLLSWKKRWIDPLAVSASGLTFAGIFFFVGNSSLFRYAYWIIFSSLASCFIFLAVLYGDYKKREGFKSGNEI
jgi:hypothetical protein